MVGNFILQDNWKMKIGKYLETKTEVFLLLVILVQLY
uniref:Uncharacterized protein n=1 Tax=Arundo donax TaxID=35708 RepID=A0A0A9GYN5_ARUDO